MKIRDIFASEFVQFVTDTLNTKCVAGETLTRAALCLELGLTEALVEPAADAPAAEKEASKEAKAHNLAVEAVVGSLITLDVIDGFETRKGPGGGIGKVGERRAPAAKEPGKKGNRVVEFPEGFIANLSSTLDTLCVDGKCIPRRDVAAAMGKPGSDTEALISAALTAGGPVAGFETRRGVGGGIRRSVAGEPAPAAEATTEPTSEETATVVEPGEVLTVEDADAEPVCAPEAPTTEETSEEPAAPAPAEGESLPEGHVPGFAKGRKGGRGSKARK